MKNIFIIDQGTGRLANQLWNAISIYAYCLEKNYAYRNAAFTDYELLFNFPAEPLWFKIAFLKGFRKNKLFIKMRLYHHYLKLIRLIFKKRMVWSADYNQFYLPPTDHNTPEQKVVLDLIDKNHRGFYFNNWLFRNPVGIRKYHKQICAYFSPKKEVLGAAETVVQRARNRATHVVGVHIRQGDYRTTKEWREIFYFSPAEVKPVLEKYLAISKKITSETVFIIASDEPIDPTIFDNIQVIFATGTALEDLMTLSMTDIIIGSNSTYGAFAAYYGDKPIITLEKNIDWSAVGTQGFNYENRCTNVHP